MVKMFRLKEWINDYNHNMCGMMSYTVSDKKIVNDDICVWLVPYSTCSYPYLYSRTSVFVSEATRIRIWIWIEIWIQTWFWWYPSVFDPITSLTLTLVSIWDPTKDECSLFSMIFLSSAESLCPPMSISSPGVFWLLFSRHWLTV
jgi:hypothetical protein